MMIPRFKTFLDQVATWPRAMQWAFWATSITIAFLVWDTAIADLGAKWSARADTIERHIAEINQPILLTSSVRSAMTEFGEVELPREKAKGVSAMTDAVHDILANHAVKNDEYTRKKTTRMRSGSLPGKANNSACCASVRTERRGIGSGLDRSRPANAIERADEGRSRHLE